ncbi:hypothetical protein TSUD_96950 [Trifolium subterraneum]|nr:hypothetical protein TSUD_96950 [Trifolium subterraneum]
MEKTDEWRWLPDSKGNFTVNSCYSSLLQRCNSVALDAGTITAVRKSWKNDIPSKVGVFGWRLLQDRLPTRASLASKGIITATHDLIWEKGICLDGNTYQSKGSWKATLYPFRRDGYTNGDMAPGRCSSWLNLKCVDGDSRIEPYLVAHYQLLTHAASVNVYKTKYQVYGSPSKRRLSKKHASFGWIKITKEQARLVSGSYDFIGVNYYASCYASDAPQLRNANANYLTDSLSSYSFERDGKSIGLNVASDWLYVYPRGIRDFLIYAKEKYSINEYDDSSLSLEESLIDTYRINYHYRHLVYLRKAIEDGVNVKGYFVWSLTVGQF